MAAARIAAKRTTRDDDEVESISRDSSRPEQVQEFTMIGLPSFSRHVVVS